MSCRYLLDANTFITAKNDFYAFDIVPSFWDKLLLRFGEGALATIDAVADELMKGNDALKDWFAENVLSGENRCAVLQAKEDALVISRYRDIAQMIARDGMYREENKQRFLSGADPWLIAAAKAWDSAVVTFERPAGVGARKIKIPNICMDVGVSFVDLYTVMRDVNIVL